MPDVVVLSYETLTSGRNWSDLKATAEETASLRASFTALWVFHGWIAERDHRGTGRLGPPAWNIKGERAADGSMNISSYDYADSLDKGWKPPAPPPPPPDHQWHAPTGVYATQDIREALRVVKEIQGLTLAQISDIIGRLPEDCMPRADGMALARGLHERGKQLISLLGLPNAADTQS